MHHFRLLSFESTRKTPAVLRCVLCGIALFISVPGLAQTDVEFFEARIRPLLVTHCLKCHGEQKQEADLRLDTAEQWQKGGLSGAVIIPGEPENSLLLRAVQKTDPDLKMPPGDEQLSAQEISDLEQWIKRGAVDPREPSDAPSEKLTLAQAANFWSFQPVARPMVPTRQATDSWSRTPIDRFIKARLDAAALAPTQDADKRTLIRRATFDLTGLPPTPEEIDHFLADTNSNALVKVIDRLLDSPAYGERWGRHWLDVARYADTAGDGADYPVREAVKYRDWVINAFNTDQPYDEFIRDQIAGDIIAATGPTELYASRVSATGFLAIGKRYGYKPSPDYQHLDFADVLDSLGRSLLGLSIGCARCHDHKYDPISAADYYALYGIMQSTSWAFPGGEEQKRPSDFPGLVPPDVAKQLEQTQASEITIIDQQLSSLRLEQSQRDVNWHAGGVDLGMEGQTIGKPLKDPWVGAGPLEIKAESQSPYRHVHPQGTRGIHLGSGLPTDGIRYVFKNELQASSSKTIYFNIDFRTPSATEKNGAYRFYLGQGVVQSLAVEFSIVPNAFALRNGSKWEILRSLETDKWYTLQIAIDTQSKTYTGVLGAPDDWTAFVDKKIAPAWNGRVDCFICDAFGHIPGPASARDIDNLGLMDTPFASPGSPDVLPPTQTTEEKARLTEIQTELERLEKIRSSLAIRKPYEVAYGVSEGPPVNARVQLRGDPEKLGDEVPRRFLEVFGADRLPGNYQGSGRLQLADWLTRPSNPLTARVFVNRAWQWHFGQGIVFTPSDFGSRGAMPTHPQLLDWLVCEFIDSGWSVKQLHRIIMQSRTYQLASLDHSQGIEVDPENKLYWKYSRRPLDAESMRDAMLAVSGNLAQSTPGPHPFPEVNTWNFTIHHPFHAVYPSNHRSVYLMTQRNRRHPYLSLFDSADPNLSIGKRQPTITPTQTLYLMNSPFVHEQATGFAQHILQSAHTIETRLHLAFEIGHGKQPPQTEFQAAVDFLTTYADKLSTQPREQAEQEAWSALARVILTSNDFLFVD